MAEKYVHVFVMGFLIGLLLAATGAAFGRGVLMWRSDYCRGVAAIQYRVDDAIHRSMMNSHYAGMQVARKLMEKHAGGCQEGDDG